MFRLKRDEKILTLLMNMGQVTLRFLTHGKPETTSNKSFKMDNYQLGNLEILHIWI